MSFLVYLGMPPLLFWLENRLNFFHSPVLDFKIEFSDFHYIFRYQGTIFFLLFEIYEKLSNILILGG